MEYSYIHIVENECTQQNSFVENIHISVCWILNHLWHKKFSPRNIIVQSHYHDESTELSRLAFSGMHVASEEANAFLLINRLIHVTWKFCAVMRYNSVCHNFETRCQQCRKEFLCLPRFMSVLRYNRSKYKCQLGSK